MDDEKSSQALTRLGRSLKWETRSLWLPPIGVAAAFIDRTIMVVMLLVGALLLIMMDTVFSIVVTMVFLRPIVEVMQAGGRVACQSEGYRYMQKTKWHTLFGSTLCVVSSTLLYVNLVLFFMTYNVENPSIFQRNNWLNPYTFGLTADSVCNDVGLLFASGVVKKVSLPSFAWKLRQTITSQGRSRKLSVMPQPDVFVPNSQATSLYVEIEMEVIDC